MIGLILTLAAMLIQSAASPAARGAMVGILIEVGLAAVAVGAQQILIRLGKVERTSSWMSLCDSFKRG